MTTANGKDFNELDEKSWPDLGERVLVKYDGIICIGALYQPYTQFGNSKVEWSIEGEDENIIDVALVKRWASLPKEI